MERYDSFCFLGVGFGQFVKLNAKIKIEKMQKI